MILDIWDNPEPMDIGTVYHERHDQGLMVRCFDCLSQLPTDGVRCDQCAYQHRRRKNNG